MYCLDLDDRDDFRRRDTARLYGRMGCRGWQQIIQVGNEFFVLTGAFPKR